MALLDEALNNGDKIRYQNGHGVCAEIVDISMIEQREVFRYGTNQTDLAIITPPEGWRLCVRSISSRTVSNAGVIKLDFAGGKAVYDHFVSVQTSDDDTHGHIQGEIDEALLLTTTTGANAVSISITYTFHR